MIPSREELEKPLKELKVCDRLLSVDESPYCSVYLCKSASGNILLAITSHNDYIYVKAVSEETMSFQWSCDNIYYNPYGVYVFGKSSRDVASKLASKLGRLKAQVEVYRIREQEKRVA